MKNIMYNHLLLPHRRRSDGTAWQDHHMASLTHRNTQRTKKKKKHSFFPTVQIIHTILSCQIRKIYGGSMLGGRGLTTEKGNTETLKENRQTDPNTGFNLNTIVPKLSEH